MNDNPIIKKRFEEKMARLNEQKLSILFSWSINASIASLSNEEKHNGDWPTLLKVILDRSKDLMEKHFEFMMDKLPIEEKWIPSEVLQERAEELGRDKN